MASHDEIRVGSVGEWVVRDGGVDVHVAVLSKQRAEGGRGYDFVVQRVDGQGQAYGRKLTRGSGSLRRPGTAVRAFGGAAPARRAPAGRNPRTAVPFYDEEPIAPAIMPMWPEATPRRVPPRRPAAPRRPSAESHLTASGRVTWGAPAIATTTPSAGVSAAPPALPSLRGRGRPSTSPPKTAPARHVAPPAPAPVPAPVSSPLVLRVIDVLAKLPPHADSHMIRGAVAEVLALDSSSHYYGLSPRR